MNEVENTPMPLEINNGYAEKYPVQIETLDIGFVVSVGCKRFAFEDLEQMLLKVSEYLRNPAEKQKLFYDTKTI